MRPIALIFQLALNASQFWHLSSDYTLKPDSGLEKIAEDRFGTQKAYGSMKVGEQVQRCVLRGGRISPAELNSELGLIALLST